MTALTERRAKRTLAPNHAPLPLIVLGALVLAAVPVIGPAPVRADAPKSSPRNSIRSIQTVRIGKMLTTYDITVTSTTEFPMRDEIVTLSIGGQEFNNSHYIPGGDLNTLVFSLTQKQFQSLPPGATAIIYYGRDDAALPQAQWALGTLDKNMLDRGLIGSPVTASPVAASPVRTGRISASNLHVASQRKGKK